MKLEIGDILWYKTLDRVYVITFLISKSLITTKNANKAYKGYVYALNSVTKDYVTHPNEPNYMHINITKDLVIL